MWEFRAQPHLKTGKSCKAGQSEFRLWMEIKWNWGINVNFLVWWMYYDCARESPIIRSMLKYLGWNSTSAFTLNVYTYIYSYLTEVYTQYKQALVVFFFFLRYWGLNPRQVLYHLSYSNSPITIFLTFLYFENFHEKLKEKRTTTYLHIIHTYKVLTHRQYFVLYIFNLGLLWTLGIRQR
jgi:hypothetical protein